MFLHYSKLCLLVSYCEFGVNLLKGEYQGETVSLVVHILV